MNVDQRSIRSTWALWSPPGHNYCSSTTMLCVMLRVIIESAAKYLGRLKEDTVNFSELECAMFYLEDSI